MWSKPTLPPTATTPVPPTPLGRISHLVLLDLLGAKFPIIRSFYSTTGWLYDEFLHSENKLGDAGLLWATVKAGEYQETREKMGAKERTFFVKRTGGAFSYGVGIGAGIEDDHIPFLAKGVPVVHLISVPFPKVWHTLDVSPPFPSSADKIAD